MTEKGNISFSKTKEYKSKWQRNYRKLHPEKNKLMCENYRKKYPEKIKHQGKTYRETLKLDVFNHYKSRNYISCACCDEDHLEFLTIDHINGGGRKHRKQISKDLSGWQFYLWLKRNNYPSGFQILCMNCNFAKSHGGCPHENRI